jgi:cell division protein FtsW (lipid II flippase)
VENKGYQIAQSLIAIASGGWVGLGLGLGSPYVIPASKTDFIFAAICEEMGILTGISIIGLYLLIMVRGVVIALRAKKPGDTLLAMGATVSLAIQSFTIIGGVVKLIPLTGVTMPFVSYGGSSMLVSFGLLGIVQGIAIKNSQKEQGKDVQQHYKEDGGCDEQEED